ncbi:hypothetical protein THAOC_07021 [Thalassiosira oceanica]|uniref:Uncharacterized protein n=1 Tax=Thalassiosira oceanica TaxID=159749 RepID=K0TL41_THAOC|nr:hypothetical protein THAOC_07021 [Thalassiosira oceanica]|eukprot:EJK71527.1 hypothetical protein THAOC_07021 [Thalassiosira oceanica]
MYHIHHGQKMSKKRSKDDADDTEVCYVVTYEEWNHGLPTETQHAVVGVFRTKEAAAAAMGEYKGTGWGAMNSVTKEDREEFGSTDNRDNPPENGLLFSLFAEGTSEGDFIRFHIEKFPLLDCAVEADAKKKAKHEEEEEEEEHRAEVHFTAWGTT